MNKKIKKILGVATALRGIGVDLGDANNAIDLVGAITTVGEASDATVEIAGKTFPKHIEPRMSRDENGFSKAVVLALNNLTAEMSAIKQILAVLTSEIIEQGAIADGDLNEVDEELKKAIDARKPLPSNPEEGASD